MPFYPYNFNMLEDNMGYNKNSPKVVPNPFWPRAGKPNQRPVVFQKILGTIFQ